MEKLFTLKLTEKEIEAVVHILKRATTLPEGMIGTCEYTPADSARDKSIRAFEAGGHAHAIPANQRRLIDRMAGNIAAGMVDTDLHLSEKRMKKIAQLAVQQALNIREETDKFSEED